MEAAPVIDILFGESHVNRARNTSVARFLQTDCTHYLTIDSDIANSAEQIQRLIGHDLPIVAGLYAKKEVGPAQWVLNAIDGIETPDENGLIEVKCAGTGFLLVDRQVFEKMIERNAVRKEENKAMLAKLEGVLGASDCAYLAKLCMHDNIEYQDDSRKRMGTMHNFFHAGVWGDRFLSEDWWFSETARAMGIKVYADTKVQLVHVGYADYPIKQ